MKKKKWTLIIGGVCIMGLLGGLKTYQIHRADEMARKIYETALKLYLGLDKDGMDIGEYDPMEESQRRDLIASLSLDCIDDMQQGTNGEVIISSTCPDSVYNAMVSKYRGVSQKDYKNRYSIRFDLNK